MFEVYGFQEDKIKVQVPSIEQMNAALEEKQDEVVGGAQTITSQKLTKLRALISDSNGNVAASQTTSTELGYLSGVTNNVQQQINGKANTNHNHDSRYYTEQEINTLLGRMYPVGFEVLIPFNATVPTYGYWEKKGEFTFHYSDRTAQIVFFLWERTA